MRKHTAILILIIGVMLLSACGPSEAEIQEAISMTQTAQPTATLRPTATLTPTPELSDLFKSQITKFLEETTKLASLTSQGVNYVTYGNQVAEVQGIYELLSNVWPGDYEKETKENIDKALEGWRLALYLWSLKIGDKDNPVEPNINGYKDIIEYGGDNLTTDKHPATFIVENYRGKTFIPFEGNIGVLFTMASDYFDESKLVIIDMVN